MVTITEWYRRLNGLWPESVPQLTYPEAVRAAKKLFRTVGLEFAHYEPCRRADGRTWMRWREHDSRMRLCVAINADRGWKDFIHMVSHIANQRKQNKPHGREHARIEMRMVRQVLRLGWLDGRLKDKPKPAPAQAPAAAEPTLTAPPADQKAEKLAHAQAMLRKSETRLKRATTLHKKWMRRAKMYERFLARVAAG